MVALCKPDRVIWVDGSEEEKARMTDEAVKEGLLIPLNQNKLPGCYLHRSNPNDVARVEQLTFICTPTKEEAGPTNNWMAPKDAYDKLGKLYDGSMRGRTMYVIPYVMGPIGSPMSKIGVELTDSIYVVLNMRTMTRMGVRALAMLGDSNDFNRGLHSTLDCHPDRRFICHFPQDNTIWSVGSGYGEQHIRREKATSNICTNQGLMATAATVYMASLGPEGFREAARRSYHNAHYLAQQLSALAGWEVAFDAPYFNEFVVKSPRPAAEINDRLLERGIVGGLDLSMVDSELGQHLLVCATETSSRATVDAIVKILAA
jgi:GTP-dependent phosphoenolpyruvate carboxykinase